MQTRGPWRLGKLRQDRFSYDDCEVVIILIETLYGSPIWVSQLECLRINLLMPFLVP